MLTHGVEGGAMLWTPLRKSTYSHWKALHALAKEYERLPLACTYSAAHTSYFFF